MMYTFHFYAASHKDKYRAAVARAADRLPLFVTEFGTVSATGGGNVDLNSSTAWLDLLDSKKISYANWTYSDANESSAAFKPGTCAAGSYTNSSSLSESGAWVRGRIRTADSSSSDGFASGPVGAAPPHTPHARFAPTHADSF